MTVEPTADSTRMLTALVRLRQSLQDAFQARAADSAVVTLPESWTRGAASPHFFARLRACEGPP